MAVCPKLFTKNLKIIHSQAQTHVYFPSHGQHESLEDREITEAAASTFELASVNTWRLGELNKGKQQMPPGSLGSHNCRSFQTNTLGCCAPGGFSYPKDLTSLSLRYL